MSKGFGIAILVAVLAVSLWYYRNYSHTTSKLASAEDAEQFYGIVKVFEKWNSVLNRAQLEEKRNFLCGTNINLDLIVPVSEFVSNLNVKAIPTAANYGVISSLDQFLATFSNFMSKGAAAERFVSDANVFKQITDAALNSPSHTLHIGGNAALIAEFLTNFDNIDIRLFGPVGPKLRPLMSKKLFDDLVEEESTNPDEIHLIVEYKAEENLGDSVAPIANRFIVHHDISNSELVHVKGFLDEITKPDHDLSWAVWSGLHFLDSVNRDTYLPLLELFRSSLQGKHHKAPLHLELASMANDEFVQELYNLVVQYVDSLGLNDQELMFLTKSIGAPEINSNGPVDKITDAMVWILKDVANRQGPHRHLTRIHMHSHRFHAVAIRLGSGWSGAAEGLLHGAFTAATKACRSDAANLFDFSRPKFSNGTVLPHYTDRPPVVTWRDGDIRVFVVPTILCKKPVGTVGLGDAISAASLVFTEKKLETEGERN